MKDLLAALKVLAALTLLTGFAYPAVVTGLAAALFAEKAAGSPVQGEDGRTVGSRLIGQHFAGKTYFWGRPSATPGGPNSPALSAGSNLAASNPALAEQAAARVAALHAGDPAQQAPIPADLVTTSASGLDPDISLEAARWQVPRIALARGISETTIFELIENLAQRRRLAFLGEPRVNVLELNLALDRISSGS
jgi:K+-transporting ATPase ATPase C chain